MTHQMEADKASFQALKDVIGNSLDLHIFEVSNGARIHAKVKITVRNGLIRTKYLHAVIVKPNGGIEAWREQSDGNFKRR